MPLKSALKKKGNTRNAKKELRFANKLPPVGLTYPTTNRTNKNTYNRTPIIPSSIKNNNATNVENVRGLRSRTRRNRGKGKMVNTHAKEALRRAISYHGNVVQQYNNNDNSNNNSNTSDPKSP
jgi:hypothetical protein